MAKLLSLNPLLKLGAVKLYPIEAAGIKASQGGFRARCFMLRFMRCAERGYLGFLVKFRFNSIAGQTLFS